MVKHSPRQPPPSQGRNAGSAGAKSQASNTPPQAVSSPNPGNSVGSADTLPQANSTTPAKIVVFPRQFLLVLPRWGNVSSPQSGSSSGTLPQASSVSPMPGSSTGSAGAHSQAGSASPRKVVLVLPSQEAVQALFLGQASLVPSQEGAQSVQALIARQAGSVSSSQPGQSAGSTGTLPQAGCSRGNSNTPISSRGFPLKEKGIHWKTLGINGSLTYLANFCN